MFKVGSHDPFGHFKHKLCPKERMGVKLTIWLSTTKSQESPWLPCVQVVCNMSLESSQQELQIFFRYHFHRRFAHKGMRPQSRKSLNFGNFETPIWESRDWPWDQHPVTKCHLDVGPMASHKYTIRGKVVVSLKFGPWWVLWVRVCPWLVLTPKVLQLCTNQLVVWFCVGPCEWLIACHSS
jgi:hypothetical protein